MKKEKTQFKNIFFAAGFALACILCLPNKALAADFILKTRNQNTVFAPGDNFQVNVTVNSNNESINAIEGKIIFPTDLLELKSIQDANSIINLWVERPTLDASSQIPYAGIIPGGYQNTGSLLFSLIFQAKKEGAGTIGISDGGALLNDGNGTATNANVFSAAFQINNTVSPATNTVAPSVIDKEPPETFTPEIAQSQDMFNGKYFLVFASQDKGSGIDHYEISEFKSYKLAANAALAKISTYIPALKFQFKNTYKTATSPYVLEDQSLESYVYIKAIDRAGNGRMAALAARYPIKWRTNIINWVIIIAGIIITLFCLILAKKIWKAKPQI